MIVDPDEQRVECHRLAEGAYRRLTDAQRATPLEYPDWDGLVIDLPALWR